MILALAQLNHSSYSPALWQGTLVYWGVMAVAILINVYASKILPKLESFILILHILGFFAILIPLAKVRIPSLSSTAPLLNSIRWLHRKSPRMMCSQCSRTEAGGLQRLCRFLWAFWGAYSRPMVISPLKKTFA